MQAKVSQKGDVFVVSLSGRIDYESADQFRVTCLKLFKEKKVLFNMGQLSFVGSSGITPFMETMTELVRINKGLIRFSGISSEFRRIFDASPLRGMPHFSDDDAAYVSFQDLNLVFEPRPGDFLECAEEVLVDSQEDENDL